MSNYLEEIENKFSQVRGKPSLLKPLDWQLAGEWEDRGIPLFLILRAMDEVAKNFNAEKRPDTINSLSYFKQAVEKQFKEYAAGQVGKSTGENAVMQKVEEWEIKTEKEINSDLLSENIGILERLADQFEQQSKLIQLKDLAAAIKEVAHDLRELIKETQEHFLLTSDIEDRLAEIAFGLLTPLAISLTDAERTAMIAGIDRELGDRRVDDDTRARLATKKLYEKYDLPELTLFEF